MGEVQDRDGALIGVGLTCWVCGKGFLDDPRYVTTVVIDPQTGLPPDLGGDASRAAPRYLCPPCVKDKINPVRAARGMPLIRRPTLPAW